MKRTEPVELMNMCMVRDGSRVLIQDRKTPNWPGITFPGGHVEPGEPFADAVIREVREETGLTIDRPRLCGVKQWPGSDGRCVAFLYAADSFTGELTSSDEGEVRWVELSELSTLPLAMGMDVLLRVFLEDDISEFFYRVQDGEWIPELK